MRCRHCGAQFPDGMAARVIDRHQISELPRRPVRVTEHQSYACTCGRCGQIPKESIPDELRRSAFGERLSAVMAFASSRMHGSRRAVEELLEHVRGSWSTDQKMLTV